MNSIEPRSESEAAAKNRANSDSAEQASSAFAQRLALREIFRIFLFFVAYLFGIGILEEMFKWSRLTGALLQFIPYCLVLAGVVYRGRTMARTDKQTLLVVSALVCVFIVLGLDVTRSLTWFDGIPILGANSRVRNAISSLAIVAGLASFTAASYFLIQEILAARHELSDEVEKLREALGHVRRLQGLLPICMHCKKIRTDEQSWQQIEAYITEHSEARFTHGLCPECAKANYPELKL